MAGSKYPTEPHPYGQAVTQLVEEFGRLPGIGRKTAERLAHHIVSTGEDDALALARAIEQVKATIRRCEICHALTEQPRCRICADPRRDASQVCVVEQPKDVMTLEASGAYSGRYHVLHGNIAPLDGVGPEDLTIPSLMKRIRSGEIQEVIMGTNPTLDGDGTALYLSNLLAAYPVQITRLARGIASGSVLEFANRDMLADAMRGRRSF